jgi:C1A family cysteine protease
MSEVQLQQAQQTSGMGGLPDYPDDRDKTHYIEILTDLPISVDLREWCSEIEDQGKLNSCTSHAAIALLEYFEKRAFGKHLDASRLFLYKVARNLMPDPFSKTGNVSTFSRTTMKALAIFGVPPEYVYPYDEEKLDEEPSAFCYAYARQYRAMEYYRIDIKGRTKDVTLQQVKANLAAKRPVMFGIIFYPSCREQSLVTGRIPIPTDLEVEKFGTLATQFGHNMAIVGYDDSVKIKNVDSTGVETTGAFLVRNSWGTSWGEGGYGWLPYDYILKNKSMDWWTMLKADWLDTGEFEPKK